MGVFHVAHNNGVTAVVDDATFQRVCAARQYAEKYVRGGEQTTMPCIPTFTFTKEPDKHLLGVFTGSNDLMEKLLKGHTLVRDAGYVPFSNSIEFNFCSESEDERRYALNELRYRTSLEEAMEAFGLEPSSIGLASVEMLP